MNVKAHNDKTIDEGFARFFKIAEIHLLADLHWAAVELVHRAEQNREFIGFTGNTQTSYTCAIYLNGVLRDVVDAQSFQDKPVRRKIPFGKSVYLRHPYEGSPRVRKGYVRVDRNYGNETALKFINSFKASKKGITMVMTTGTEYSVFIEEEAGLDVLTKTYKEAGAVINKHWKPIP